MAAEGFSAERAHDSDGRRRREPARPGISPAVRQCSRASAYAAIASRYPASPGATLSNVARKRESSTYVHPVDRHPAVGPPGGVAGFAGEHTPDPAAFEAYLDKMRTLSIDDQHITDDGLRGIAAPTMVVVGDADGVTPEHALAMFRLRGGGDEEAAASGMLRQAPRARLVILPATSHIGIFGQSAVLAPMVTAFLDDTPPITPNLF